MRKLFMMPLWRVTEAKGHILEMNQTYYKVTQFLDGCIGEDNIDKIMQFMRGEYLPFSSNLIERDSVYEALILEDDNDTLVCGMLQACFLAINSYLKKTVAEHLPGGRYWDASDDITEATSSCPRHNKNPEFVFGLLYFLCRNRPNASTLSNEAILMYIYNHTSDILNSKSQN